MRNTVVIFRVAHLNIRDGNTEGIRGGSRAMEFARTHKHLTQPIRDAPPPHLLWCALFDVSSERQREGARALQHNFPY